MFLKNLNTNFNKYLQNILVLKRVKSTLLIFKNAKKIVQSIKGLNFLFLINISKYFFLTITNYLQKKEPLDNGSFFKELTSNF